jgi:hypothetical protein
MRYPDGRELPLLNGVKRAAPIVWPPDVPYAPVTGTAFDGQGNEWYVHVDGSRSTTIMGWRADLGRMDAFTLIANPVAAAPLLAEELPAPQAKR